MERVFDFNMRKQIVQLSSEELFIMQSIRTIRITPPIEIIDQNTKAQTNKPFCKWLLNKTGRGQAVHTDNEWPFGWTAQMKMGDPLAELRELTRR